MNPIAPIEEIRNLIAKDQLNEAVSALKELASGGERLNEVIMQAAKLHSLESKIRQGLIRWEDADINKNQIRLALLRLLEVIEGKASEEPLIQKELEHLSSITNSGASTISGNINIKGTYVAGRDMNFGDIPQPKKRGFFQWLFGK